ncbi:microsomal epoxide hydrolase [Virgisporangium aliadipatigenens]|uniref:Microsomal epoxide hydrolase n=1 Tax=Virgisporangium aliadipatigenens TaxID=741659 RepID=A0A8J3YF83_9ACTN|nr:epoxide hydrolase family protein [Virgisporangium aliadipatigenens]GIJ43921.1 microsomal epoxide hydrolase [Virgisporangium aliadipatigenens]
MTLPFGPSDVDDLRVRLARTRWPDEPAGAGDRYGLPLADARDLATYWAEGFDFDAFAHRLDALPHHAVQIDGATVHCVHARSSRPDATALLLTHGWPGSILEFTGLLDALTEPDGPDVPAFHVVVPSIPGFGLSGPTRDTGWGTARIARAFDVLMNRLGYDRYGAHGGDWGALITRELALMAPQALSGQHLTMLPWAVARPGVEVPGADPETVAASARRAALARRDELGYGIQQGTRPMTLAYGLTDSPVGQLAWIAEKIYAWSDPACRPDRDTILANVSLYWFTRTAGSSARLYREYYRSTVDTAARGEGPARGHVRTGVSVFPHDTSLPVRELAERLDPVERWTVHERGGHFPGWEQPDELVAELREFLGRRGAGRQHTAER